LHESGHPHFVEGAVDNVVILIENDVGAKRAETALESEKIVCQ
jgi:hypothetical protein